MDLMTITTFRNLERQAINQQRREIYSHELAHKNAAGNLAGPIVIEKDSNGMPIGGHVTIKMPKLNKVNPQETIDHASRVIKAALAPTDPSSQDYKVASRAKNIKTQAQNLLNNKRLDYYA